MGNCACDVDMAHIDLVAPPSVIYIELTAACNNACPGCGNFFRSGREEPGLSGATWQDVVSQLASYRPQLRLSGGEPTLHPDFARILRAVDTAGLEFSVFTNACWLDADGVIAVLSRAAYLQCILVSLHGARRESHEAFTGSLGSFELTLSNINRAVRAGLHVVTSTVITRHNYREIEAVLRMAEALGAERCVFNRYIGAPLPLIEADDRQLRTAIETLELCHNNGWNGRVKFGTPVPSCHTPNHSNGCMAGFAHVTIDPWGNVHPCPHVSLIAGNVAAGADLENIIASPAMLHWRSGLLAQCDGCTEIATCRSACQAMAWARNSKCDPLVRRGLVRAGN